MPLVDEKEYLLVTLDFLLNGGDVSATATPCRAVPIDPGSPWIAPPLAGVHDAERGEGGPPRLARLQRGH